MKNILSFGFSISLLSSCTYLWSPFIILLGFLRGTDTTYSCSWSSGFSWSLLPLSLDPSSMESLSCSIYGHKLYDGSYSHLISSDSAWWVPLLITPNYFSRGLFTNGPDIMRNIFPPHIPACGALWWVVSFPPWLLIPSLFFRASIYPHKKANAKSSLSSL